MRTSIGAAVLIAGAAAGYVTGQQALGRAGQVAVSGTPWVQELVNPKDTYALYAVGHFRSSGLLPPNRASLLYTREVDEEGNSLRGSCTYQLSGHEPAARWWSISVAPAGQSSATNSLTARDAVLTNDGDFSLAISKHAAPGNWLQTGELSAMRVMLVLNEPYPAGKTAAPALPALKRIVCE